MRKRKKYDLTFKLTVAKFAEESSGEAAAKHFSVDPKRVREWRKNEAELQRLAKEDCTRSRLPGGGRKKAISELQVGVEGIHSMQAKHLKVSRKRVRVKAECDPISTAKGRQRNRYNLAFKLRVLKFAEEHSGEATARHFSVDPRSIRLWRKNKAELQSLAKEDCNRARLRGGGRKRAIEEVGVCEWIDGMQATHLKVSRERIRSKAKCDSLSATMGTKRKRYDLTFKMGVVKFAEENPAEAAARHFSVHPKLVRDWRREKAELKRRAEEDCKRSRLPGAGRKQAREELEESVCDWMDGMQAKHLEVSRKRVRSKAKRDSLTTTMGTKRKKYDLTFKLTVLKFAEENPGKAAARHFSLDPKRVRDWRKNKAELQRLSKIDGKRSRLPGAGRKKVDAEPQGLMVLPPDQPAYKTGDLHLDRRAASLNLGQNEPSEPEWTTRQAASTPPEVYESADERPMMKSEDFAGNMEPSEPEWTTRQQTESTSVMEETASTPPEVDLLNMMVKVEDMKEEEYGHMIAGPDEEEKPFAELPCKTETDVTESNVSGSETQQTIAEIEVKIEEDDEQEHNYLLQSVQHSKQKIHGQNDELQLGGRLHHCTVCRKSFTALTELEKHQRTHSLDVNQRQSSGKKQHICAQCGKAFLQIAHLRIHMRIHTGEKPHQCDQCGRAFSRSSYLKRHLLTHTREKPHICAQCGKAFLQIAHLRIHMRIHTGEKPHQCDQCGRAFSTSSYLKRHLLTHTREKPHICAQCGKAFLQIAHLRTHMRIHTGEKPHQCDQCGRAFSRSSHLKRHLLTHTREKPHICAQCGKAFSQIAHVKIHMFTHTDERLHKCTQCGKAFAHTVYLKAHMLIHIQDGERPHKCAQCGKGFTQSTALKRHMLMHTGEKPHKCGQCGKAFAHPSILKKHMRIHTGEKPHKCVQCGKAFIQNSQLKTHMVIHTGEKPHKCDQCGKAFTKSSACKTHMLIHTGEKPHRCDQCGKAFKQMSELKNHRLIHTGEKPHKCVQ
ncbi:zinc finger protein 135-like [Sardina pilchardus]|uniref:zinc finger protein 135-like n=1 Tax=Sardina pilchardus TaxID=27697 RepID=UPI002E0DC28F